MRAAVFDSFGGEIRVERVADPVPKPDGVVLRVLASGVCRSDWHGWQGHDPMVRLPHVPGHELAGEVVAVGAEVRRLREGMRVTVPFVSGCGTCPTCARGEPQVCDRQYQPGFSGWGSFAELVALRYADLNVVELPEALDAVHAATLGCRFGTSYRAVVELGRLRPGEWIAVFGCGGVGLSALCLARALGARAIGVDIDRERLALARELGAERVLDARGGDPSDAIAELTGGGAQVAMDALGDPATLMQSVSCLAKRGRHLQVGLLLEDAARAPLPMDRVIARELEVYGCHGIKASSYPALLAMVGDGRVDLEPLIGRRIALEEVPRELAQMSDHSAPSGIAVIDRF